MRNGFFILLLFLQFCSKLPPALEHAHAHNDYQHERPLFDALDAGFISVEADIFLRNDTLFVTHDSSDIVKGNTLESLYLLPLKKYLKKQNGHLYSSGVPLTLLIDFKSDANETYKTLSRILKSYSKILTAYTNDRIIKGN